MSKSKTNLALLPASDDQREQSTPELKSWSLVELFGHQRIVGWVTVDPIDFPGMVRVDVPDLLKEMGRLSVPDLPVTSADQRFTA